MRRWRDDPVGLGVLGVFLAGQLADVVSTWLSLRHGGVEANPIMAGWSRAPAGMVLVKVALLVAVAPVALWFYRHTRWSRVALLVGIGVVSAWYLGVVAPHNLAVAGGV